MSKRQEALDYHSKGRKGKIEVITTKPCTTSSDLSLAYSPGVAEPCLEIEKNPEMIYEYTAKGNLVAVVSNGTAVLGLGNIGAMASKPVMEGKAGLFKSFADIDVFDLELNTKDSDELIRTVKSLEPTFGGINLEDIKGPECFYIEEKLKEIMDIPVFHDDQHGTAIVAVAGMLNALELVGKEIENVKMVINGAGAAGIACANLAISLGINKDNVILCDTKGVIYKGRIEGMNEYKERLAVDTNARTLADAMINADIFFGVSAKGAVSKDMLRSMNPDPVVFAMANPDPEITPPEAKTVRSDVIIGTGRSDYTNQVNNVLCFPFLFRGALDTHASAINEDMKIAAVKALAELAKQDVPDSVRKAYAGEKIEFGREYLIPKPFDPRVLLHVAPAVAKAAMHSGVSRKSITDWDGYKMELMKRMGMYNKLVRDVSAKAKISPKRIVFANADHFKVLKAIEIVQNEGIAKPILLGDRNTILELADKHKLKITDLPIVDIHGQEQTERRERFANILFEKRCRKGLTLDESVSKMYDPNYFGIMMVETGEADGFLGGFANKYADTIRPALQLSGSNNTKNHISGMHIVMTPKGPYFFADTTVNYQPSSDTLADTTLLAVNEVRKFDVEPVVALVSYSNFGSTRHGSPKRVRAAVEYLHANYADLLVDGEMQANYALNTEIRMRKFPFSKLGSHDVNTVVFPNLSAGNAAFKIMKELGKSEVIGPILLGIRKPIHVLQIQSTIREIVDMAAITVVDAQTNNDEIFEL
jgi:malate dehydrogenase (oxaloacetate-decarboxylating)(NADP+)